MTVTLLRSHQASQLTNFAGVFVAYVFSLGCLRQTHLLRFQVSFDSEELVSVDVPKATFLEGSKDYENFHD